MTENKVNFIPNNPVNFPVRPLNKGIQLHIPPQMAPRGSLQNAENYQVTPSGLKRRGAHIRYVSSEVDYPPIQGVYTFFEPLTGLQKAIVVDQKFIYEIGVNSLTGVYWTYSDGTMSTSGNVVTGSGTLWGSSSILAGDIIVLDPDGSAGGPEEIEIESVDSDTQLTLVNTPSNTYAAGEDYEIRRAFKAPDGYYVEAVAEADGEMLFTDGTRPTYYYDGTTFGPADPSESMVPFTIAYFRDRIWYGHTLEGAREYRYRIRWTDPGVFKTMPAVNYLELPYQTGEIVRLVPMGNSLVAFYSDAIYIGIPSQIPTLPVYFQRLDTGNIGLVGPKAVTSFFDAVFFVGQDDIYKVSTQGIEPIGTPIVKKSIEEAGDLTKIWAVTDSARSRVVFGFPKSGTSIEELWTYDYRSKAWGVEKVSCYALSSLNIYTGYTIDDLGSLASDIDDLANQFSSIDAMTYSSTSGYDFFIAVGGYLEIFQDSSLDQGSARIVGVIETQDYDLDVPNKNKTWYGVSLKVEDPLADDLTFTVEGSTDRGATWKSLGTLTVNAGDTEGKINFRLTGSIARFKFTSTTDNDQYTVNELVYRVKLRGQEVRF